MRDPSDPATWLSDEVADQLASQCPGLRGVDILEAAAVLAARGGRAQAASTLTARGAELACAMFIVERLRELQSGRPIRW